MNEIFLCYQCRECASGCPVAYWFDVSPPRLLQLLQVGETEKVLKSRTPWLCASCETCATECPHRLDLGRVMSDLTTAARDCGINSPVSSVSKVFLPNVNIRQRATELGLIPPASQPLRRFAFELRWLWHQLAKDVQALLERRVPVFRTRAPKLAELLLLAAVTVFTPPIALGFAGALMLHRFHEA